MLDSLQGRSPIFTFGQITTNPEFENCVLTWDFFEGSIHSRSYSHIIQSMYPDPQEVFDSTFDNKVLTKHTKTIIRDYNKLYPLVIKYLNNEIIDKQDFKEKLILAMVSVNILEGIRFYSGFASVWALTEFRNIFSGSSRILQLIARDENVHMSLTQSVLNILRKNEEEGFSDIIKKLEPKIYDMYFEASEEEFEWIDFLYQHGTPLGINENIAKEYIKYLTNLRLRAIGMKSIYPGSNKNPITWINKYLNLGSAESALQEIESVDYQTGGIIMEDVSYKEIFRKS
jgi:ribonucleoside-diphosphate reductase beta chain